MTADPEVLASAALSLARSFAAGGTLWCVCRQWPAHGRHVAVEFVHPVIVGKRALPAVHLDDPDPASSLRYLARPGDMLVVIGTADHEVSRDLLRRAQAWGLLRLWLGAGPAPGSGYADHLVWLGGVEPATASRSGDLVLLYHLLWELTHVVFEHPGLLETASECEGPVCVTCADQAVVAEIRGLVGPGTAKAVAGGRDQTIDVSLVQPIAAGDLVLVHAGVGLALLSDDSREGGGSP